jgi:hypothetical protein
MVDRVHLLIQKKSKKPLAIALSEVGKVVGQANQCTM